MKFTLAPSGDGWSAMISGTQMDHYVGSNIWLISWPWMVHSQVVSIGDHRLSSEMESPKSVICGDTMQLAPILLAQSFINSWNVVSDTDTKDYRHLYDLWSLQDVGETWTSRMICHVLLSRSGITRYCRLPARRGWELCSSGLLRSE